jgi:AcrR family transcriptional regulator
VPRTVNHAERRAELSAAVRRIAADRGIGAASLREVAAEAGWSLGALRHYFATREAMLRFAFESVAARAGDRIERARRSAGGPRERLEAVLLETVPLDDERRTECRVWLAFFTLADASRELTLERERVYGDILHAVAALLEPLLNADRDADDAAALLWAAVDGIVLQALAAPEVMTPERQRAAIAEQVALVLGR